MDLASQDFLSKVIECGFRHLDARSCCIHLDLTKAESNIFMLEWENLASDIRHAWDKGRIANEQTVMDALENQALGGNEGSGDAARALGYLQRKRTSDALKQDLFGI